MSKSQNPPTFQSNQKISLVVVDPTKKEYKIEDALLSKFHDQFYLDKKEQMPDFNRSLNLTVETTVRAIHRSGKHLWFIMHDLIIIGYVTVVWQIFPVVQSAAISDFFIDKPYRGRGFGLISLDMIIAKLFEYHPDIQRVSLTVFSDNLVAKDLYSKIGFVSKLETMILEKDNYNIFD